MNPRAMAGNSKEEEEGDLHLDFYQSIPFRLGMMIDTTAVYSIALI